MIMHTIIDAWDSQTPDVINFSFNEKIGRGYNFVLKIIFFKNNNLYNKYI